MISITDHQKREVIRRRDHGDETLAVTYGVKGYTVFRLGCCCQALPSSNRKGGNI